MHHLVSIVNQLIEAENKKDKGEADSHLSRNFKVITRASGKEENRNDLLDAIASGNPKHPNIHRILEDDHDLMLESADLAVIRSIVRTTEPDGRYRNIHIFVKEDERWRCVVWQVTELK